MSYLPFWINCNVKRSSVNVFPRAAHCMSENTMWLVSHSLATLVIKSLHSVQVQKTQANICLQMYTAILCNKINNLASSFSSWEVVCISGWALLDLLAPLFPLLDPLLTRRDRIDYILLRVASSCTSFSRQKFSTALLLTHYLTWLVLYPQV